MNINNPNPDNHTHPLANQLVRNRLGQWPHTPGTETTLTVKFLAAGKDPMNIWPEVENPGPFTSEEIHLTKAALKTIEETTNLRFIFVEEGPAQITFGQFQQLTKKQRALAVSAAMPTSIVRIPAYMARITKTMALPSIAVIFQGRYLSG